MESKLQQQLSKCVPFLVLAASCAISLLIATNVRCHSALTVYLYRTMPKYGLRDEFHWLGSTHGMVVYLFVPLFTGVIDHFKVSYRISALSSGLVILASSVLSTGLSDPGYLILTDTILTGLGASAMLSTIILVIDDCFPATSSLRIFATTLVQGVAFGTFFLVNGYSALLKQIGWKAVLYAFGISSSVLGLIGCFLFNRNSYSSSAAAAYRQLPTHRSRAAAAASASVRNSTPAADDELVEEEEEEEEEEVSDTDSVIEMINTKEDWKGRLLSLSQTQLDSSRTTLLWLLERQLAALISDGAFLFLLQHSGMLHHPLVHASKSPSHLGSMMTAFIFSIGSTSSYLAGSMLGNLIKGQLLIMYMAGSLINICSFIGWAAVLGTSYHGELIFAWACGFGIGGINSVSFAASEEATGIAARSVFPFTKMLNGLSIIAMEISHSALSERHSKPSQSMLLVLLLLSVAEFSVLLLVRQINSRQVEINNRFKPRPSFRD